MKNPNALSNFNFGEYDARREFLRAESYFLRSFITPSSFEINTLNNRNNYIIVGQKGAGKTACQLYLENEKSKQKGFICTLLSFYDDITQDDYRHFSTTQRISFTDFDELSSIELL